MSIKIDGTQDKEKICKEDGSEVRIVPSLYLNEKEITASGGGSTSTETSVEISECKNYAASKYSDADKVIVNVKNWTRVEPTSGYYEINANDEYPVSQFNGYKGICVTKEKEEEGPEPDPEPVPEVDDIIITWASHKDNKYNYSIGYGTYELSSTLDQSKINFDNYRVKVNLALNITYKYMEGINDRVSSQAEGLTITLYFQSNDFQEDDKITDSTTLPFENFNAIFKGTLEFKNQQFYCTINLSHERHSSGVEDGAYLTTTYYIPTSTLTISQTPKTTTFSTLSLRQSETNTTTYENLVVNNDALIQGNLNVDGYINDFKWYWDEIVLGSPNSVIGQGLLARLLQCSIIVDNVPIAIPELQLSPGAAYVTDIYTIQWTADGYLLVNQNIDSFTGTIKILRYE